MKRILILAFSVVALVALLAFSGSAVEQGEILYWEDYVSDQYEKDGFVYNYVDLPNFLNYKLFDGDGDQIAEAYGVDGVVFDLTDLDRVNKSSFEYDIELGYYLDFSGFPVSNTSWLSCYISDRFNTDSLIDTSLVKLYVDYYDDTFNVYYTQEVYSGQNIGEDNLTVIEFNFNENWAVAPYIKFRFEITLQMPQGNYVGGTIYDIEWTILTGVGGDVPPTEDQILEALEGWFNGDIGSTPPDDGGAMDDFGSAEDDLLNSVQSGFDQFLSTLQNGLTFLATYNLVFISISRLFGQFLGYGWISNLLTVSLSIGIVGVLLGVVPANIKRGGKK